MDKREKAIVISMIANGCEFRKEMAIINNREYELDEFNRIVELADEALEKQIPKKAILHGHNPYKLICSVYYTCPNCNNHISITPYCDKCGQALDWSESNDKR